MCVLRVELYESHDGKLLVNLGVFVCLCVASVFGLIVKCFMCVLCVSIQVCVLSVCRLNVQSVCGRSSFSFKCIVKTFHV